MAEPDDLPGPSIGELRAAGANMLAASLAATMDQRVLKVAADHQSYLARAVAMGVCKEDAARVLAEIVEDRSRRGLPLEASFRLALAKLYDGEANGGV